ncbi:hypothetical protein [Pontibacter russatus]|uniref:hypothetical protein n=1 Tax=Pontibacter russatus TaxID=2694929 RepID=UPI00137B4674|nr:hypothetical protein [Pontibacter russatus]
MEILGLVLGAIGLILTIGFGIYSIWTYEKSKRTVSLEFQNKECYSLFRDDVNRLNIEMSYNKQPISSTLILLKARIINNGKIDIDKNRVYNPLRIISTNDFKWLEFSITSHPDGASTKALLNNAQEVQVEWDLLKKEEFIEVEALVEILNGVNLGSEEAIEFFNGITFDFRITDLSSVQKENQLPESDKRRNNKRQLFKTVGVMSTILGVIFLTTHFVPALNFLPNERDVNFVLTDGSKSEIGSIASFYPSKVALTLEGTDDEIKLSVAEFNKKYKVQRIDNTIEPSIYKTFNLLIGGVYTFVGLLLFSMNTSAIRKRFFGL